MGDALQFEISQDYPQAMRIIDISTPIHENSVLWPGCVPPELEKVSQIQDGGGHNESLLKMNVHTGTHIDAPNHFIEHGKTIDQLNIEIFYGEACVVDVGSHQSIDVDFLENAEIPKDISRLLFKTKNSYNQKEFYKDYVGVTTDAATWFAEKQIKLIGVDYLSVARFEEAAEVHKVLLSEEIVLLEGINLKEVEVGVYELICFPVNIKNSEGAPARAVLINNE